MLPAWAPAPGRARAATIRIERSRPPSSSPARTLADADTLLVPASVLRAAPPRMTLGPVRSATGSATCGASCHQAGLRLLGPGRTIHASGSVRGFEPEPGVQPVELSLSREHHPLEALQARVLRYRGHQPLSHPEAAGGLVDEHVADPGERRLAATTRANPTWRPSRSAENTSDPAQWTARSRCVSAPAQRPVRRARTGPDEPVQIHVRRVGA